jgi:CRP-like cAMP-binding protein
VSLERLPTETRRAWSESFLSALPERASAALIDSAIEIEAASGQLIYREMRHPTSSFMALVVSGLVRVYVSSETGREITIRYAKRADIVGLPAVIARGAPTGVQAVTRSHLLQMQVNTMRHLVRTDPDVAWPVAQKLTDIIFETVGLLSDNVFKSVRDRVSGALLELARNEGGRLVVRASQQELADAIGSVREVVARTLRQLRDDGLIERTGNAILLVDPTALARTVPEGRAPH